MYTNNSFQTDINIQLNNGLYIFEGESATGKTRLFNELRNIQKYEQSERLKESIVTYTYNDYLLYNVTLEDILKKYENEKLEVIILDRYDMYGSEEYIDSLVKISKDSIILVDCKSIDKFSNCTDDNICFIEMDETSITVTD